MFNGSFIAGINTPSGIVTYHIKLKYWDMFNIPKLERAPKYDGTGSLETIERLLSLLINSEKAKEEMKRAYVLVPTNTAACVLIFAEHKTHAGMCWNPTLDDLLADDWQVTGRLPEGLRCAAERLQDSV